MVAVLLRFCKAPRNDEIALQHFFFLSYSSARIFFYYICATYNFFLPTSACRKFFFQNQITPPPPLQELNGRPLINSLIESWGVRLTCLDCKREKALITYAKLSFLFSGDCLMLIFLRISYKQALSFRHLTSNLVWPTFKRYTSAAKLFILVYCVLLPFCMLLGESTES